jgi:hypothetical protein
MQAFCSFAVQVMESGTAIKDKQWNFALVCGEVNDSA